MSSEDFVVRPVAGLKLGLLEGPSVSPALEEAEGTTCRELDRRRYK